MTFVIIFSLKCFNSQLLAIAFTFAIIIASIFAHFVACLVAHIRDTIWYRVYGAKGASTIFLVEKGVSKDPHWDGTEAQNMIMNKVEIMYLYTISKSFIFKSVKVFFVNNLNGNGDTNADI